MKHLLLSASFALASLITGAGQPVSLLPVNSAGQPVLGADSARINYSQTEIKASEKASAKAARTKSLTAASTARGPLWQYSVFGTSIGAAGIRVTNLDGAAHIFASGSSGGGFGGNDFWQVLRYRADGTGYEQVFVSRTYDSQLIRLFLGTVTGTNLQIVAVLANGEAWIHDAQSRRLEALFQTLPNVNAACLTDLDGDGLQEIITVGGTILGVFGGGTGTELWWTTVAQSSDVVAAQMDSDPAIEIAVSGGQVIDAATHSVQWNYSNGFGARLVTVDANGDGRHEIIGAQAWQRVEAFDVQQQASTWAVSTPIDIGAVAAGDVDGDNIPEFLWGDGQWGAIHVLNLTTHTEKWQVNNPDHGVTFIAVGNADSDAAKEILWGAGASSTGPDYLHIADAATRAITWSSIHLDGPFVGASVADLDGDGRLELIACSTESDSGYNSGRIVVFDAQTRQLRAISPAVGQGISWTGVRQLLVRDVDHDGKPEILIAADRLYDGLLEIYSFSTNNSFTRVWANTNMPSGSPFNAVEVADLNGSGADELVVGNDVAHSGSSGVFVRVYDYATRAESWTSQQLSGGFYSPVIALSVAQLDHDAAKEIVAVARGSGFYVIDSVSHAVERSVSNHVQAAAFSPARDRIVVSTQEGALIFYTLTNSVLQGTTNDWSLPVAAEALFWTADDELWVSSDGVLTRYSLSSQTPTWQSPHFGDGFGRSLAFATNGTNVTLFTTDRSSILALAVQEGIMPSVTISTSTNQIEEEFETTGDFIVRRSGDTNEALSVLLDFKGSATAAADYTVAPSRLVTIPAGADKAIVTVKAVNDNEQDMLETIIATVLPDGNYIVGEHASAEIQIVDDDTPPAMVGVNVSSEWTRETPEQPITVWFYRFDFSAQPLTVNFTLSGSAVLGEDFTTSATNSITFPPWSSSASLYIYPKADEVKEVVEDILMTVLPNRSYTSTTTNLHFQIRDDYPIVTVAPVRDAKEGVAGEQVSGVFQVRRQGASLDQPLTVYYRAYGTADRGDFVPLPGYLVIPAGKQSGAITLQPLNDRIAEQSETVQLALLPSAAYELGNGWATIGIEDDEPTVEVIAHGVSDGILRVVIGRTGAEERPVRVIYGFRTERNGRIGRWHFQHVTIPAHTNTMAVLVPIPRAQGVAFMLREARGYWVNSGPVEWRRPNETAP